MKHKFAHLINTLQNNICDAIEKVDGKAKFRTDEWQRKGGGGGKTRVIEDGDVFEKGGVNVSVVHGELTAAIKSQLKIANGTSFYACGISLVIHPYSPMIPTSHANYRYFEILDDKGDIQGCWFGGGADLTPYYLFEEDAKHFHQIHKNSCDKFDPSYYTIFKKECDDYFINHHRNGERRGIGGIFYDYQQPQGDKTPQHFFDFAKSNGQAYIDAYIPIVERTKHLPFTPEQKEWQLIRRGRYVEFNLIHDRGTIFGLKSNGRTESILMSLPKYVKFEYDYHPEKGSAEEALLKVLNQPQEWV